jgi:hypothetical protein
MKRLPKLSFSGDLKKIADVLDEALLILEGQGPISNQYTSVETIQPSLFEQCIELCRQVEAREAEPIRTLHHLSCTGGTLITKCLAAMPNIMVLNEVDPLSNMLFDPQKPKFTPSDMVALIRQGDNKVSDELLINLFFQNLVLLRNELASVGKRLLLRYHCHSHFMMNRAVGKRTSVFCMVAGDFPTHSILTVRNPLDSFLSLDALGWKSFQPFTFDEYCKRYMHFLDAHEGLPVFKYEDFVDDPARTMEQICAALRLSYTDNFFETFDVFKFSGDSGRSGATIKPRKRRSCDEMFLEETKNLVSFRLLLHRLGYEFSW